MTYKVNYDLIEKGLGELAKHNLNQEERLKEEIRNNHLKAMCALVVCNKLQNNLIRFEKDISRSFNKYIGSIR